MQYGDLPDGSIAFNHFKTSMMLFIASTTEYSSYAVSEYNDLKYDGIIENLLNFIWLQNMI